jgi:hypothetical protein
MEVVVESMNIAQPSQTELKYETKSGLTGTPPPTRH